MKCNVLAGFLVAGTLLLGLHPAQAESSRGRERLERDIRHELVMLPYHGVFDHLAFQVDGYKVTLLGQVTRPTLKADAERLVKRIEGVESVNNQIEVLPLSPNDDRIRLAAYRALYGHNSLYRYALRAVPTIHIIVKNGDLTLEGAVATEADKNIAGLRLRSRPANFHGLMDSCYPASRKTNLTSSDYGC